MQFANKIVKLAVRMTMTMVVTMVMLLNLQLCHHIRFTQGGWGR